MFSSSLGFATGKPVEDNMYYMPLERLLSVILSSNRYRKVNDVAPHASQSVCVNSCLLYTSPSPRD